MLAAHIPSSGESLKRIGLGTYRTFDISPTPENLNNLEELVNYFLTAGGRLIDTSPMYGLAEKNLGHILSKTDPRTSSFLATKVWTQGLDHGIEQILNSFDLLKREQIELLQIHNLLDWKIQLSTLQKMKAEGAIKYIGITHYAESAFPELEKIMRSEEIDFLQIPFNVLRNSAEKILLPLARDKNIAVIANEPLDHGNAFRTLKHKQLPPWAAELGIKSWATYFLKYILSNNDIQFVIPATRNLEHLKENMKADEGIMPNSIERRKMQHFVLEILRPKLEL